MKEMKTTRRDWLRGAAALGLSALFPGRALGQAGETRPSPGKLRVAFLTDMHVFVDRPISDEGIQFTLRHLLERPDRPDLVITGGDNLTGTMGLRFEQAMDMRRRWEKAFRDACPLPMIHCVGNHDVWGWNKATSGASGNEPLYGKAWAREQFQIDRTYYARELGGWKFIILDSVQPFENRYVGGLEPEQFEWLRDELEKAPATTPIVVVSHIPITGISPLIVDANPVPEGHRVPYGSIYTNMYDVVFLLSRYPNVRLVLSGHIHFEERVEVGRVTYLNGGAVSGAWWRTSRPVEPGGDRIARLARAEPGYVMLELLPDGSFTAEHVRTGFETEG